MELPVAGKPRWYNLHKAAYADPMIEGAGPSRPGMVMLIRTSLIWATWKRSWHNDRLASVGRLAAGVAHEIGNPVTGIASLAQNLRHEDPGDAPEHRGHHRADATDLRHPRYAQGFSRGSRHLQQRETFAPARAIDPGSAPAGADAQTTASASRQAALRTSSSPATGSSCPQVLVNLMGNAADASKPGDRVDLLARASADRR